MESLNHFVYKLPVSCMYTYRIIAACMNYMNNEMSHRDYM
jgi:hypothetical protein